MIRIMMARHLSTDTLGLQLYNPKTQEMEPFELDENPDGLKTTPYQSGIIKPKDIQRLIEFLLNNKNPTETD